MNDLSCDEWLEHEDLACREQRVKRLSFLAQKTPQAELWMFSGGWLSKQLFEEARYSFVYGQFIAASVLGFAFVERTLASLFYASGRNDLQRATGVKLIEEAVLVSWLSEQEAAAFNVARCLRNPLVHFRHPMHEDLPDTRAFYSESDPHRIVEADAEQILEVMFRLVAKQAPGADGGLN
ncbi:MAG: hypothetical protein V4650_00175 [Pseudomonadota bacterium]